MTFFSRANIALIAGVVIFGASSAVAQEEASCNGLRIVSLETSNGSSAIDGELTTFTFNIAGTIEAASPEGFSSDTPVKVVLKTGDDVRKAEEITELAAGEQLVLKIKATKWSPYEDYGFDVVIGDGEAEGCTLSMDGSAIELSLRGQ